MMEKRQLTALLTLLAGVTFWTSCTPSSENPTESPSSQAEPIDVTVSILPQKYFVERIGGETVDVNVMVEPGASPATYEPKPQQMKALSDAEAYLAIGVPFEQAWMSRIKTANKNMKIVDLTAEIERQPMAAHHHHEDSDHNHGPDHTEETANPDPHIWLSPELVKKQAETIYTALVELNPEQEAYYQENRDQFISDINQLDQNIEKTLADLENRTFMVFHPAWGYFAREYNLEMIPVEVGGTEPSASEMSEFIKQAKAEQISVIFVQPQFGVSSVKPIAQSVDAEVLEIDPLAENWLENMQSVATTFQDALSSKPEQE
ncbi:MAG: metal ABC transporter solute-binding protein, Zn/Mn family [Halothece sp.]